jgi:hypothetical protein
MDAKLHLGYQGLIKPEIDLIETILRTSSRLNGRWTLVTSGECDAILTYNAEKDFHPLVLKQNSQVIMIKRRGEVFSGHAFFKPFRADELIDTLILIESNDQPVNQPTKTVATNQQHTIYRLKKWPPAELLSLHKNYMLLAVYLSRGTKTLKDLMTLSGHSENFCMQFILLMNQNKLLESESSRPDIAHTVVHAHVSAHVVEPAPRKNFLSLLRDRLGLGKS